MSPFEWWSQQCLELDEADKALAEALDVVTRSMIPGSSGMPSEIELDVLDLARRRRETIWQAMDEWMKRQLGQIS